MSKKDTPVIYYLKKYKDKFKKWWKQVYILNSKEDLNKLFKPINKKILKFKCKKCNYVFEKPFARLHCSTKKLCPVCGSPRKIFKAEVFILKAKRVHGDKYNYSMITQDWWEKNYKSNQKTKLPIICPKHGLFYQKGFDHLRGNGCPICKSSHGERLIAQFLIKHDIKFEHQKKFEKLYNSKTKRYLPVDFYLPDYNLIIEFNGRQHYELIDKAFGSSKSKQDFERLKYNDKLKENFAKENNIDFLVIRYDQKKNIENILKEKLNV